MTYGDKYEKFPGKVYEHPSPPQLIADGLVEAADGAWRRFRSRA
jgi:hypothetical protein